MENELKEFLLYPRVVSRADKLKDKKITPKPYQLKSWRSLGNAYIEAAQELITNISDKSEFDKKLIVAMFCIRHYIELEIKTISILNGLLLNPTLEIKKEHNLKNLWARLIDSPPLNVAVTKEAPSKEKALELKRLISRADYFIDIFSNIDKSSYAFRYPNEIPQEQELTIFAHLNNYPDIQSMISELQTCFDGIYEYIDEYHELVDSHIELQAEIARGK